MEFFIQFHFLRPAWLLALIPAALLCLSLSRNSAAAEQWRRLIAPHLLPYLLDGETGQSKRWPIWGLFGLWVAACLSLAGPTWTKIPQPVERSANHLVVAWDMSPSMLAEDVTPSRLERARLKLIDLLKSRNEGQAALIAYAGEAYTVTPLTDDYQTIINLLPALSPTTLPSVGSNPEMALTQAQELLRNAGALSGDILFVTDEIPKDAFSELRRIAQDAPYRVSVWGVGTTDGAPIPLPGGGFAKDDTGNIVVPKLNEAQLSDFTAKLGGYYIPMVTAEDSDVETLERLLSDDSKSTERSSRMFDQWFDHGQLLAFLLLPFVALLFRRGWIFCVLWALPYTLQPQRAEALSWIDLWKTQDQQAQDQLEQGDLSAAKQFTTPERRGSALYQQEKFAEAAKEFAKGEGPVADYNRGTALTRAGQYEAAVKAFDQALQQDPQFKRAEENRAIAQRLAEQQQQQQQQQQNGKNSGDPSSEDQQQASSGQQNQQGQEQGQQGQQGDKQGQEEQNAATDGSTGGRQNAGRGDRQGDSSSAGEDPSTASPDRNETAGENPYSQVEAEPKGEQPAKATDLAEEHDGGEQDRHAAVASTELATGQSEEEQMLEQILRKVPDDPSGLLRNKFKYQYLQRRQSLPDLSPYSNNEAEQRW